MTEKATGAITTTAGVRRTNMDGVTTMEIEVEADIFRRFPMEDQELFCWQRLSARFYSFRGDSLLALKRNRIGNVPKVIHIPAGDVPGSATSAKFCNAMADRWNDLS
jgi:hypothetical protein